MALKRNKDGTYVVKTAKDAAAALNLFQTLAEEIAELEEEHGITEMKEDCVELKKAATQFAIETDTKQIDFDGHHATLVNQPYDARFVLTKDEIPDSREELFRFGITDEHGRRVRSITPLRVIVKKKFKTKPKIKEIWNRITVRTLDREALEEVIAEGLLTVDEVAPAFIEKNKAPYLRIFED